MEDLTLKRAYELFIGHYENKNTIKNYRNDLLPMIDYIGPARPVHRIQNIDLVAYVNDQVINTELAKATKYKKIKTIKIFFNWLLKKLKVIEVNPADAIDQIRRDSSIDANKAMTDEELEKILRFYEFDTQRYAIVLFLAETGCRRGGAATLRISDLDLENNQAVVTEKGGKTRVVWFQDTCKLALMEWLVKRGERDHDYIFCHSTGPYNPHGAAIAQIIRRACYALGLRSLGSHSLRHRMGFKMAENSTPVSTSAQVLGNTPEVMMRHYYHVTPKMAAEAARKVKHPVPLSKRTKIIKISGKNDYLVQ